MKAAYDIEARKRPVNLSLNEDLVAQAQRLTGNLSGEVERLLAGFGAEQRKARDAERDSYRKNAEAWSRFHERHGSLSDEFSTL